MTQPRFFEFGTSAEAIKACLSLIERGCRGEITTQKINRCNHQFASQHTTMSRKRKPRQAA